MRFMLGLIAALSATWLLLSGHSEPLILGFGVLSVALVVVISERMGIVDVEGVPLAIHSTGLFTYIPWLLWQVVLANLDVVKRILGIGGPLEPSLISVKPTQASGIGRVLFANSITLTPGTVSMRMYDDEILVHALHGEAAADLLSGEMDRRVTSLEREV